MAETVTIYVSDQGTTEPVNNVFVGLYNFSTKALIQSDFTGSGALDEGQVIFSNVVETDYEVRVIPAYVCDVINGGVQKITVLDLELSVNTGKTNTFDFLLTPQSLATATNTRLCRCSGYFVDSTGTPYSYLKIHFSEHELPQLEYQSEALVSTRVVVPNTKILVTDKNGFGKIDLYRGARYSVVSEGLEDLSRIIEVPALSAANLADVLYPCLTRVQYKKGSAVLNPLSAPLLTMTVATPVVLSISAILRSGVISSGKEVVFTSSNTAVLTLQLSSDGSELTLTGLQAGSAIVNIARAPQTLTTGITVYPEPPLVGALGVTITA